MTEHAIPDPAPAPPSRSRSIVSLLRRPPEQRRREHKYRFSQAVVFGLPVVALEVWGDRLGGPEAGRWVGVLQALLAGWVTYVGAAGMLFEGLAWRGRRFRADLAVALIAVALYLAGLASVLHVFFDGRLWYRPLTFHWVVILLAVWTGWQWWRWSRR